jgi:TrmH family RNA methyltransferase
MVPKKLLKFVNALQIKKYRLQEQSFIVEGSKSVVELLQSTFQTTHLFATEAFIDKNSHLLKNRSFEIFECSEQELEALGSFKTNDAALAVASMNDNSPLLVQVNELALALDDIRDPGNMGTILRIADWYGITKVICSSSCVDFYNPKVIAASMGSFTRVKLFYVDLQEYLSSVDVPVYGAFLEGENIHQLSLNWSGILIIGNESKGIGQELEKFVSQKLHIPRFGGAESLNAGVATAVILDNFRRYS